MATSLPPVAGKKRCRVQAYCSPETFHTLFTTHYPSHGAQARIIAHLLTRLAHYVSTHCTPTGTNAERELQLLRILSRVSFDEPAGGGSADDEYGAVTGALGDGPYTSETPYL